MMLNRPRHLATLRFVPCVAVHGIVQSSAQGPDHAELSRTPTPRAAHRRRPSGKAELRAKRESVLTILEGGASWYRKAPAQQDPGLVH